MSHFAEVIDGVVTRILSSDQEAIDTGNYGEPSTFIETTLNTHAGVNSEGDIALRMNTAEVGSTYDSEQDIFLPEKPFPSWILDITTYQWGAPTPYPWELEKELMWDESQLKWVDP